MAIMDHYRLLGVSRRENFRGIRDAYLALAKQYHPDRAGPDARDKFRDIQQAYENLSDPEKKSTYDRGVEQNEMIAESASEPITYPFRPRPEFRIPSPISLLHEFRSIHPSFEPLYDRFIRNFTGKGVPKGERVEPLNIEIDLSDEEAMHGGILPVGVPVFVKCRQCDGSGRDWLFPCTNCHAEGMIEVEAPIEISIPPIRPDKFIIETPLQRLGIQNFYLCLHMRIAR